MSTTTSRLGLVKPDRDDDYLVDSHYNPNIDTLDAVTRYNQNETITGLWTFPNAGLKVKDVGGDYKVTIQMGSTLSADRALNIVTGDANRELTISGDATIDDWFDQSVKENADVIHASLQLTDMSVAGIVKNDALGNLSGGNGVAQSDIAIDADWDIGAYDFRAKKLIGDNTAGEQLLLYYTDPTVYGKFTLDSNGYLQIIASGGRMGINTAGPDRMLDILDASNPQLRLTQADGSKYADFQVDSNGYMTISPSGTYLGVNIVPENALHILKDASIPVKIQRSAGGIYPSNIYNHLRVFNPNTTDGNSAGISFATDDLDAVETRGAEIVAIFTDHTISSVDADLAILTSLNGTMAEKMRIKNSGYVGINTTGPDRRLDILDASNPQLRLTHTNEVDYADFQVDTSGYLSIIPSGNMMKLPASAYFNFGAVFGASGYGIMDDGGTMKYKNSGGSWYEFGGSGGDIIAELNSSVEVLDAGADGRIVFTSDGAEIARINATGLGIFNNDPQYALDVTGDIYTTGLIFVDGNEADGKFLKSQAGGIAIWETLPAAGAPTYTIGTFTNSDATPDVSSNTSWRTATTGTTITDFDGGTDGMEFSLIFANGTTIIENNSNIKLAGGDDAPDFNGGTGDTLRFLYDSGVWYELGGRSIKSTT